MAEEAREELSLCSPQSQQVPLGVFELPLNPSSSPSVPYSPLCSLKTQAVFLPHKVCAEKDVFILESKSLLVSANLEWSSRNRPVVTSSGQGKPGPEGKEINMGVFLALEKQVCSYPPTSPPS